MEIRKLDLVAFCEFPFVWKRQHWDLWHYHCFSLYGNKNYSVINYVSAKDMFTFLQLKSNQPNQADDIMETYI
jgi:hypothetical protein